MNLPANAGSRSVEVAKWSGVNNNSDVANKILQVVREVSNERVDGKPKDNYHTWRYFVEILASVPTSTITDAELNLIPIWLGRARKVSFSIRKLSGGKKFLSTRHN